MSSVVGPSTEASGGSAYSGRAMWDCIVVTVLLASSRAGRVTLTLATVEY